MTLLVDAGPLVAAADRRDPRRAAVQQVLRAERGSLIVPAAVAAEADHLLRRRVGAAARRAFLADLTGARFRVECPTREDYRSIAELERTYDDLGLSLADLSLVALARRFRTRRLLTFDERDFRAVRPLQGGAFELMPADIVA